MYEVIVKVQNEPSRKINLVQSFEDKKIRILSSTVETVTTTVRKVETKITKFVDVQTGFVVEKTDDITVIEKNPVVVKVRENLVKQHIMESTYEILETSTQTSNTEVEVTLLTR